MPFSLRLSLALLPCLSTCAGRTRAEREPPAAPPEQQPAAEAIAAPPATAGPTSHGSAASGSLLVTENEYQGWRYYHLYCDRCHGQDALGTIDAPNLRHSITREGGVSADSFFVIVRVGSTNKEMPPFHELLDDQQVRHIYAYVSARSENRLAAGRPRRAPRPPR